MTRPILKLLKPALLWLNAWQYKDTEEEVAHLVSLRDSTVKRQRWLRKKQVRLTERRNWIAGL